MNEVENYVLINGRIYTETVVYECGYIEIEAGEIVNVQSGQYDGDKPTVDVKGGHIVPGFIDIHIHGGYGQDVMDGSYDGLIKLTEGLLSEGTTSFLATTMTQSVEKIDRALNTIATYVEKEKTASRAEIIGVHLEGPYISCNKVGAQHPEYVQKPSVESLRHFQTQAQNLIKIVTIAPEVDGAAETIAAFHDQVIFSIGHTVATYDEVNTAAEQGARHVTHLYNAGTPFEHRNPGQFGAAWLNDNLNTELIVDGIHAHPAAIKIAYKLKGNKGMYLITDAMRAKGMPDGMYDLGGQNVIVKNKEARLESGALAGSILCMNVGLKHLIEFTEAPLADLWRVTSLNQAIALGIDDRLGSIKRGKAADLVVLNDNMDVCVTIKNGDMHTFEPCI